MNDISSDSTESQENNTTSYLSGRILDVLYAYVQQIPSKHDWRSITITRPGKYEDSCATIVIEGSSGDIETLHYCDEFATI